MTDDYEALAMPEIDTQIERIDVKAVAILNRSEVEAQLDAAHKYPRSIKKFLVEASSLATLTRDVAESCIYALTRGDKTITGPSVRLAEICASAYGNLHVGARVIDAEDKEIVAQGVAWDLEKNLRVTIEARRRITNKGGKRYNDDMITVTGAAASSIALRNAIFRAIPKSYVNEVYNRARAVAVGDAKTLAARRSEVVARLQKIGVPLDRILPRVGKPAIEDVTLDDVEILIGLGTSIKNNDTSIDEAFPAADQTAAKNKKLEEEIMQKAVADPQPPTRSRAAPKTKQATAPNTEPSSPPADNGRDDEGAEAALGQQERIPGEED
jgi:hypothetical protein